MQSRIWSCGKQHPTLSTEWAVVWIRGYLQRYVFEKYFFCCSFHTVVFSTHYMVGCADLILLVLVWKKVPKVGCHPNHSVSLFSKMEGGLLQWKKQEQGLLGRQSFASECTVSFLKPLFTSLHLIFMNFVSTLCQSSEPTKYLNM